MLLAIIILVVAGAYTCVRSRVQVTGKLVIAGRPARSIGLALISGGVLAVALPALCGLAGFMKDFAQALLLSLTVVAVSLSYAACVALAEQRRLVALEASAKKPAAPAWARFEF